MLDVLGVEILSFVKAFFTIDKFPTSINTTSITLILKVESANI